MSQSLDLKHVRQSKMAPEEVLLSSRVIVAVALSIVGGLSTAIGGLMVVCNPCPI
jgi:hypothetical protein